MKEIDVYVGEVIHNIHAPSEERERIKTDLQAHLQEAVVAGEPVKTVLERMGTPAEVAAGFMAEMKIVYAGLPVRLLAFAVDLAIIMLVTGLFILPVMVFSESVPQNPTGIEYISGAAQILLLIGSTLGAMSAFLLYFPILEGRFGQTIGKRLFGLRVLKENGLPVGYKEAILRRLSYYFEILAIDALFIPFTAKKQRAFDIVAKTIVVKD